MTEQRHATKAQLEYRAQRFGVHDSLLAMLRERALSGDAMALEALELAAKGEAIIEFTATLQKALKP